MARGRRRPIEDKIIEKEEIIKAPNARIKKEARELEDLISEQKQKEVENPT